MVQKQNRQTADAPAMGVATATSHDLFQYKMNDNRFTDGPLESKNPQCSDYNSFYTAAGRVLPSWQQPMLAHQLTGDFAISTIQTINIPK